MEVLASTGVLVNDLTFCLLIIKKKKIFNHTTEKQLLITFPNALAYALDSSIKYLYKIGINRMDIYHSFDDQFSYDQ